MFTLIRVLALIGATLIVTQSTIFRSVRRRLSVLKCNQCVGFWIGVIGGACNIVSADSGRILDAMFVGCAVSLMSHLAGGVTVALLGEVIE